MPNSLSQNATPPASKGAAFLRSLAGPDPKPVRSIRLTVCPSVEPGHPAHGQGVKRFVKGTGVRIEHDSVTTLGEELDALSHETHAKGEGTILTLSTSRDGSHADAEIEELHGLTFDADGSKEWNPPQWEAHSERLEAFLDALESSGLAHVVERRLIDAKIKAHIHFFFSAPVRVSVGGKEPFRRSLGALYDRFEAVFGLKFDRAMFGAFAQPVFAYSQLPGKRAVIDVSWSEGHGIDFGATFGDVSWSGVARAASVVASGAGEPSPSAASKPSGYGVAAVREALTAFRAVSTSPAAETHAAGYGVFPDVRSNICDREPIPHREGSPREGQILRAIEWVLNLTIEHLIDSHRAVTDADLDTIGDEVAEWFEPIVEAMRNDPAHPWKHDMPSVERKIAGSVRRARKGGKIAREVGSTRIA